MDFYYVAGVPYSGELYHYGILGQKWGVRRYENLDGTLTPEGKKRYNRDSDSVAYEAARKYEASARQMRAYSNAKKRLLEDPDSFSRSRERSEYINAYMNAQILYDQYEYKVKKLLKKYSSVDVDVLTENGTGEQYVKAVLLSKKGKEFVSELYLGAKVV